VQETPIEIEIGIEIEIENFSATHEQFWWFACRLTYPSGSGV